jgi:hypothetical protein
MLKQHNLKFLKNLLKDKPASFKRQFIFDMLGYSVEQQDRNKPGEAEMFLEYASLIEEMIEETPLDKGPVMH